MKKVNLIHLVLVFATSALAQTTPALATNPVTGGEKNTVAVVEAMPADKFTFKPSADEGALADSPEALHLDVFVGDPESWGVTSTLIYGKNEAILVDRPP